MIIMSMNKGKLKSLLKADLKHILFFGKVLVSIHVKKIASLVGQIISMSYVIGNVAHIMTKFLSIDILSADTWNSFITLSDDSIEQISFWKNNLSDINVRKFTTDVSCNTIVYSDASSTGYGGYIVENPDSIAHGMWSDSEKLLSSTWKELTAVKKVLFSLSYYVKVNGSSGLPTIRTWLILLVKAV